MGKILIGVIITLAIEASIVKLSNEVYFTWNKSDKSLQINETTFVFHNGHAFSDYMKQLGMKQ